MFTTFIPSAFMELYIYISLIFHCIAAELYVCYQLPLLALLAFSHHHTTPPPHATENKTYAFQRWLRERERLPAAPTFLHNLLAFARSPNNMTSCVRERGVLGVRVRVRVCVAAGSNRRYYYVIATGLKLVA